MSDHASESRKGTKRRRAIFDGRRLAVRLVIVALVLGAFIIWFSPYWAVAGLAQAAKSGDVQAVSQRLDVPRLRESMKGQLVAASQDALSKHESAPLQVLGVVASMFVSDKVVDAAVTR